MRKFIQNKLKDQKGLTLIELLAVIVILAIIAAIAIPAIGNIIENSRVGAIKSDAQNAIAAANLYYTDNTDITADVTLVELASDSDGKYLEDLASFKDNTAAKVTRDGLLTGIGKVGNISVEFTDASKDTISKLKNSANGSTATSGAATVSGR